MTCCRGLHPDKPRPCRLHGRERAVRGAVWAGEWHMAAWTLQPGVVVVLAPLNSDIILVGRFREI